MIFKSIFNTLFFHYNISNNHTQIQSFLFVYQCGRYIEQMYGFYYEQKQKSDHETDDSVYCLNLERFQYWFFFAFWYSSEKRDIIVYIKIFLLSML